MNILRQAWQAWREVRKWRRLERAMKECYPNRYMRIVEVQVIKLPCAPDAIHEPPRTLQ